MKKVLRCSLIAVLCRLSLSPEHRPPRLRVQLRSEAGAGLLDVLALRLFSLPQRIFVTTSASPSLLPPATVADGKHAAICLIKHGSMDRFAGNAASMSVGMWFGVS